MPSSPLDGKQGRTTSGVACHHHLWAAHTVGRRRAWHAIIGFGQHTRSNDVGRGMPSSPLGRTNGRMTSGVACHHRCWTSSHSRTASGVACHHRHWTANTVKRRRAWHAIITFGLADTVGQRQAWYAITAPGQHTRSKQRRALHAIIAFGQCTQSNDVGRGMPSWTFDNIHG